MARRKSTDRPPGRPPRLDVEQVVTAAIAIVDESGLEALSMPKLAGRLGVGTMTLYTYVENKDDLLDRMASTLFRDLEVPTGTGLNRLGGYFRSFRLAALRHPALTRILATGRITIPKVFDHLETLFSALQADGIDPKISVRTFYAALSYTIGFVVWETPRAQLQSPEYYPLQWAGLLDDLDPANYPILTGEAAPHLGSVASEAQFEWGLQTLLSGIAHIGQTQPGSGPGQV